MAETAGSASPNTVPPHDDPQSLLLEIERLRACLRGIASCATCDACRGAALMVLGEVDG
jgi:hypothetical protein